MVLDDIHCALHKKLHCAMLIDLSKAFDTVDHTVLVQRLKCIGITGHVLQWFVNYMSCNPLQTSLKSQELVSLEEFKSLVDSRYRGM
jgi:hypothetical protein